MTIFTRTVAGVEHVENVPDELADYFRAQLGYSEVLPEAVLEEAAGTLEAVVDTLTGPALDKAAAAAGVPSGLKAAQKREALVAATDPTTHEEN